VAPHVFDVATQPGLLLSYLVGGSAVTMNSIGNRFIAIAIHCALAAQSAFSNRRASLCLSLMCTVAMSAHGNIITVTNPNDSGPGSLRQALADANNGDTIDFNPALVGQTVTLTTAELVINKNIAISGPGADLLTVSRDQNAAAFRILHVSAGLAVSIQGLKINNGSASQFACGGGILVEASTLSVMNCAISDNSTDGTGGGVCVANNATVTIESSTLSGNYAGDYGGGVANSGTVTINNSTLVDNYGEFTGGGILNDGGSLTVSNSTLTGNGTQLHGGGLWNGGNAVITSTTFSGNNGQTAGAIVNRLGTLEMKNSVLTRGDVGPNIVNDSGTVTSLGYNLSDDDGGGVLTGPGDQISTEPLLGALQDNGGPTFTHALLPGSPAIDTGDPKFTPPPFHDQRGLGFDRVVNGRIDKGSFEVQGPTPTATPQPTATVTATATPTATPRPRPTPRSLPTPRPRPTPLPRH
jgi:hypothetical protein